MSKLPSWGEIEAGAQRTRTAGRCKRCESRLEAGECPIHGSVGKRRGGELCTVCAHFVHDTVCPNPECGAHYDGHYHKLVAGVLQHGASTQPCPNCKMTPLRARAMRDFILA